MENKSKVDQKDLKIIAVLEEDGRMPLTQLAKKLHTSQQVISYRMQSLQKKQVIGGYYTIIDITKLGYTSYRTMLRLTNTDENIRKEIISFLKEHPNILWIVDCGGKWDILVNFMAKNIVQYDSFLKELKNKFPENIQNYDVLVTVEGIYFGKDYLTKDKRDFTRLPSFGGETSSTKLDKFDLLILKNMAKNGRINAVDIAQEAKMSPNTIVLRMKKLRKDGLIQGVKPLIHLENIGYQGYKALIKFQNIKEARQREIIRSLQSDISVVGIIRLVGLWDFEIEFEVQNQKEMLSKSKQFRDQFRDVIKEFEILPLFHEYRYNFFPADLLETRKEII